MKNGILEVGDKCPISEKCDHPSCEVAGTIDNTFTCDFSCAKFRFYNLVIGDSDAVKKT